LPSAVTFALQRGERLARQRPHAILDRLQPGAQHRDRRAQLVRDVGHEAAAQLLVACERLGEAVEVLGQPSKLVARRDATRVP
jgi:hypothetical protein